MRAINRFRLPSPLLWAILYMIVHCGPAFAATQATPTAFVLGDFETIFELDAQKTGSPYRVHLDEEVFRVLHQSAERDLAIFDAAGKPLPFAVRDVTTPYDDPGDVVKTREKTFSVPLFPLPRGDHDETGLGDVVVRTDGSGRVVEIRGGRAAGETGSNRFLLDLTPLTDEMKMIERYRIDIPLDENRDVAATADVFTSPNLRDWQKIAEGEPLISLRSAQGSLESRHIELSGRQNVQRYLMLTISGALPAGDFVTVTATAERPRAQVSDETASYMGTTQQDGSFLYDTGGAFPLRQVQFALTSPGVYSARIEYRRFGFDQWLNLGTATLFLTGSAGETSRNDPLAVRPESRQFRLSFPDGGPDSPPSMNIAWRPQEVVFMAQGAGPYLLACGSEKQAPSLQRPDLVNQVLSSTQTVTQARITERRANEGSSTSGSENAAKTSDWQQYMVWTVLIAGALFFSWTSWSLLRKEKK